MTAIYDRFTVLFMPTEQRLRPQRAVAFMLLWALAAVIAAICMIWLNHHFGKKYDYPSPQLFARRGLVYLAFSFVVGGWLALRAETARFSMPWTIISLIAGICFYPFLFCDQSFLITNFLSADWSYPLSQIQPPAKLVNPEPHDSSMLYFPLKYFWTESIREHMTFPFWDFARNSGMPFAAATLSGAFYPLNAIFLVTGTELGWGTIGLIHLLIGGCGMFLLIDRISQSRFAALYAGISFMLMPYLAGWSRGLVWNSSGVWLPLICFFTYNAITQRSVRAAGLAALALAMATLGGWIQWVIYFYLLLGIFVLQYVLVQTAAGRVRAAGFIVVMFSGIVALALLLSVIHLGPFHEVTSYQPRTKVPWDQIKSISFPFGLAANFAYLVPCLFGDHIQNAGAMAPGWSLIEFQRYLGALCFPLMALAFARRETARIAASLIIPVLFFLSVTNLGIGYKLLYQFVPGFDAIPTQQIRALFVVEFIFLLIAGLGAANLRRLMTENSIPLAIMTIGWAVFYLALAFIIFNNLLEIDLPDKLPWVGAVSSIKLSILFLLTGLLLALLSPQMKMHIAPTIIVQAALLAFSTSELIIEHHKLASFSKPLATDIPPIVSEIKAAGNNRIFRTGGLVATHAFIQNTASMVYGLNDTMAHDSVYLESYAKFLSLFNPLTDYHNPHALLTPVAVDRNNVEMIRMLNVDYIFHKEEIAGTTVDPGSFDKSLVDYIRKDGGRHILRLKNPLPRAFFVQHTQYLSETEVMSLLPTSNFKATETAYLAEPYMPKAEEESIPSATNGSDSVEYSERGPNSFVLHYSARTARPIFISNVTYPGWRAVTNSGTELQIHRANLAFMVVFAPPAANGEIIFKFRPTYFRSYLVIFSIAVIGLIVILVRSQSISRRIDSIFSFSDDAGKM